jgi:preprotein translocase subunit SecA
LIDEARTPLIISGQSGKSTKLYEACDVLARQLTRGEDIPEYSKMDAIMGLEQEETGDFIVNEKDKVVNLTQQGVERVEKFFHIENLADPENLEIQHNVILALRAHNLMFRDQDYVVKDDQVLIVDEFTGRIMPGRRYSDGLHQAIEAKEHVKVKRESKTLATITFQNFFNKFEKKAGMTGTALTEEKEFRDIYGMDVIEIPTNREIARVDHQDAVYKTKKEKFRAVVEEVKAAHEKGQPVLVGTITIETSELISGMLKREGIPHTVLNAKFHEQEAEIVAQAGQHGAVTIATNMAGRGTDIKLDDDAREAGGLKIIGTERHESRRIDNQLRGRSGRQGDPGESQFFISLEDDLMRLFGSERLMSVFNALGVPENEQIQHKMLTSAIEKAQQKIEYNNYGIRKNLLEYDQVNNDQREIIYAERLSVLNGESMRDAIFKMIQDQVENAVDTCISAEISREEWDLNELNELLIPVIPLEPITEDKVSDIHNGKELKQYLKEQAVLLYEAKETEFPEIEQFRELERVVLLKVIDRKWMDHIDDMDQLRQGIGLQAYGQRDPLVEYKMAGFDMFDEMISAIQEDTIRLLFHVKVEQKVEREQVAKVTGTNKDESAQNTPKKREHAKVYPNDPCPCGSGKKYKQCCGRK